MRTLFIVFAVAAFVFVVARPAAPRVTVRPVPHAALEAFASNVTVVTSTPKRGRRGPVEQTVCFDVVGDARRTRDEAFDDALARAAEAVESMYGLRQAPTADEVKDRLIVDQKELTVPIGEPIGDAKKFALKLKLEPDYLRHLARRERDSRMTERMDGLARALAFVVAGLFAVAGYVRADEWSKGYFTGWLKFAAAAGIVGAGVVAWVVR
jgi:hypothetical protein